MANRPEESEETGQMLPLPDTRQMPPNDERCTNRCNLNRLIIIGGTISVIVVCVICAVVFSLTEPPENPTTEPTENPTTEPAENSIQQQYENQNKLLHSIGCFPKPEVKNILSLLSEKDDLGDYEIEERFIVIFQCNDDSSFCGVNGNSTCKPTENGQAYPTFVINIRNRHIKNSEWQKVNRTLNIMNHTECVCKAVNSVPHPLFYQKPTHNNIFTNNTERVGEAEISVQELYENQKKLLQGIGCSPKPVVKNMLSLLPDKDDIGQGDYEIEERFIVIFQCNDHSSFCGVDAGICTCEPTANEQTTATAIIKFRDHHIKNSEWQYVHRTLNIMNHTECVSKAV